MFVFNHIYQHLLDVYSCSFAYGTTTSIKKLLEKWPSYTEKKNSNRLCDTKKRRYSQTWRHTKRHVVAIHVCVKTKLAKSPKNLLKLRILDNGLMKNRIFVLSTKVFPWHRSHSVVNFKITFLGNFNKTLWNMRKEA